MNKSLIDISELSVGYKNQTILSPVNLSLTAGKLVVLVGRNGSGKTTLFKTLTGQIPPISGRILINSKDLSVLGPKDLSALISVVLTEKPNIGSISVRSVVSMGRHPYSGRFGRLSENDEKIIDESLEMLGITKLQFRSISEISDGEFQKMMLARALAQDTEIILMDEPASFLDYPSKIELLSTLKKLSKETGKLIVFSSHEIPLIKGYVDIILGIKSGKLLIYEDYVKDFEVIVKDILEF